jgi:hypothetical protein
VFGVERDVGGLDVHEGHGSRTADAIRAIVVLLAEDFNTLNSTKSEKQRLKKLLFKFL